MHVCVCCMFLYVICMFLRCNKYWFFNKKLFLNFRVNKNQFYVENLFNTWGVGHHLISFSHRLTDTAAHFCFFSGRLSNAKTGSCPEILNVHLVLRHKVCDLPLTDGHYFIQSWPRKRPLQIAAGLPDWPRPLTPEHAQRARDVDCLGSINQR